MSALLNAVCLSVEVMKVTGSKLKLMQDYKSVIILAGIRKLRVSRIGKQLSKFLTRREMCLQRNTEARSNLWTLDSSHVSHHRFHWRLQVHTTVRGMFSQYYTLACKFLYYKAFIFR